MGFPRTFRAHLSCRDHQIVAYLPQVGQQQVDRLQDVGCGVVLLQEVVEVEDRRIVLWSYLDSVDSGSIQAVTEGGHHIENRCSQQGKAGIQVHRIA